MEEGRVRGPRLGQFGAARYVLSRLISARLGSSRHQFGPTRAALAYTVRPLAPEDKLLSMAAMEPALRRCRRATGRPDRVGRFVIVPKRVYPF